ncbi:MAG: hypothetical protein HY553_20450 [Elusimicrobia bacterium]|nr:hypothetical protein [Elusimicrobiota bacterium]
MTIATLLAAGARAQGLADPVPGTLVENARALGERVDARRDAERRQEGRRTPSGGLDAFAPDTAERVQAAAPIMDAFFLGLSDAMDFFGNALQRELERGQSPNPAELQSRLVAAAQEPSARDALLREFLPGGRTPVRPLPERLSVRTNDDTLLPILRDRLFIRVYWELRVTHGLTPSEYLFADRYLKSLLPGARTLLPELAPLVGRLPLHLYIRELGAEGRAALIRRLERDLAAGRASALPGEPAKLENLIAILKRVDRMIEASRP